ncbi:hypothetical protein LTR08_003943 [Meristemomyces frigidus]|nr:hypothetical protein LTR08_003943 [Meristemomyces frigidus]
MPRARKRAVSPVQVEEHPESDHKREDETEENGTVLQFDEALTWKAGKPIAVSELSRRLKALAREVQSMEEDADRESLVPKAQELASAQLTRSPTHAPPYSEIPDHLLDADVLRADPHTSVRSGSARFEDEVINNPRRPTTPPRPRSPPIDEGSSRSYDHRAESQGESFPVMDQKADRHVLQHYSSDALQYLRA